ncbi:MAG: YbaK/EbsC family protein [Bacteroidales bacterium]
MIEIQRIQQEYYNKIENDGRAKIEEVENYLKGLNIEYKIWYHPALPTIKEVLEFWDEMDGAHCKNLFFRNHKGNRHYLVIIECHKDLEIAALERRLKEGKLTFASPHRLEKHLGVKGGAIGPFGLLNNSDKGVILFIDTDLQKEERISFHPNDNRASISLSFKDFIYYLEERGNLYHFI